MITAFMSTFHRVYASSKPPQVPITNQIYRYHGFQTNGEPPQIPNEHNMEGASVVLQV